jgi:hypothetical protein
MNIPGGFDSPDCIVFMGHGKTEDSENFVSQDPFHSSVVCLYDLRASLKKGCHQRLNIFRIMLFHHPSVTGDIAEQNSQMSPFPM